MNLLRDGILPRTRQALANAQSDYAQGNVDFAALISALREVLQVELQVVQVEAELGKALALLERAVGCQLNEHPPAPAPATAAAAPDDAQPVPPAGGIELTPRLPIRVVHIAIPGADEPGGRRLGGWRNGEAKLGGMTPIPVAGAIPRPHPGPRHPAAAGLAEQWNGRRLDPKARPARPSRPPGRW